MPDMKFARFLFPCCLLLLSACEQIESQLGIEDQAKKDARLEAEGKAIGGGCRHSGRAIEDCYAIYSWVPKEAVFAGWREMDAYMRENTIATVAPVLPPPEAPGSKKKKKSDAPADASSSDAAPAAPASAAGNGDKPSGSDETKH
jgi:hypothetical protein